MKMNETVMFKDWFGEKKPAKIVGIFSDKFEEVKLNGDDVVYWSIKGKDYRKVKDKDINTVYLEMETPRGKTEFIMLEDVIPTK